MWDPPRPGLEPVSPALAGGFLTTAPPGKPLTVFFFKDPHVSDTRNYLSFSAWLISLSIMPSSFIHVVTNDRIYFFHIFNHRWPLRWFSHLGYCEWYCSEHECKYLFNSLFSFPLGIYPEVELLDHMIVLFLICWVISILFSIVAAPIYNPTNGVQGFPFIYILTNICSLVF